MIAAPLLEKGYRIRLIGWLIRLILFAHKSLLKNSTGGVAQNMP
ncbi:hypothetical protein CULC0102_1709 [Corynebacterium ulcerans 0102]|nr:hypothetical protein CULC0102_1709 [Corynebacterium ulcerans 0102]